MKRSLHGLIFVCALLHMGCSSNGSSTDADGGEGGDGDGGEVDGALSDGTTPQPCQGVVVFPDPNLEQVIRQAIGKPSGDILSTDLLTITFLEAGQQGITDLTGMECVTALASFHPYSNQIDDISPLAGLVALEVIDLDDNQVSDLSPLAGLTALNRLTLWNNQVVDIGPLVANSGIGQGDYVEMLSNPIDCAGQATNIAALEARGVVLHTDCP